MAGSAEALAALAELERRYDGPIPAPLRRVARFGSIRHLRLTEAESQADFFTRLIRDQLVALRDFRGAGAAPADLAGDFALYWRQRRRWRGEAARLGAAVTRSAGDDP